jgi:ribosome biogenesis ATPase
MNRQRARDQIECIRNKIKSKLAPCLLPKKTQEKMDILETKTPIALRNINKPVLSGLVKQKALKHEKDPRSLSIESGFKNIFYSDFGGIEEIVEIVREFVQYPIKYPEVFLWLGVTPPLGVLLHGPPGCGKTTLANAIANESSVPLLKIYGPEIICGISGESEAKIRSLFSEALSLAPCIVFIDEIDTIASKAYNTHKEMERRILAQIVACMDNLNTIQHQKLFEYNYRKLYTPLKHVAVLGSTNHPDRLDPSLRRAGRFDREILLGLPMEIGRKKILERLSKKLRLEDNFNFNYVAKQTNGFVGADLKALIKEAATQAIARKLKTYNRSHKSNPNQTISASELTGMIITKNDFDRAFTNMQPSIKREGFMSSPNVTWYDVGSLEHIRAELEYAIIKPIQDTFIYEAMGIPTAAGVLLYGPPGCGKTLVAKAVANEATASFIYIQGPELLDKYVGESERAVRKIFSLSRAAAPCILFFDEIDALAPKRVGSENQVTERLVNQLLTEMDGAESRQGLYIIAATNRPDMLDPALLRPGRLEKLLLVPLPSKEGRASILKKLARKIRIAPEIDLFTIALDSGLEGFTGADLTAYVNDLCVFAIKKRSLFKKPVRGKENYIVAPVIQLDHVELKI